MNMETWMVAYQEGGMVLLVGLMFVYLVISMSKKNEAQQSALEDLKIENRGQSETIENVEGIILKLLIRMDKSDERLDRKFSDLSREINDLDNQVSRIDGSLSRINGKH
tara:strand:- start:5182 stop:5508 length:327 start_codon:yes stop_codon:yes gene_type:complete